MASLIHDTHAPAPGTSADEAGSIAAACCDRWADGANRPALLHLRADDTVERIGFDALRDASLRFARALAARGAGRGARVAIQLPQGPEALVALFAADRLGAIAVLPGPAAGGAVLARRLQATGAMALVTDAAGLADLEPALHLAPSLRHVFCTDGERAGALGFWAEAQHAAHRAPCRAGGPGAAALLLLGADAMGRERGVLHAARSVLAQEAGFVARFGPPGDSPDPVWTALPWGRCGGLLDVVLPALALGVPVVAHDMPAFNPGRALEVVARLGVGGALLPPEALFALRDAGAALPTGHRLRRIVTQGGALPPGLLDWARAALGVPVTDSLVRPECGVILVTTPGVAPGAAGAYPPPGREVAAVDAAGRPLPAGQPGRIALRRPDPGLFLGHWGDTPAARPTRGGWFATDATGTVGADGGVRLAAAACEGSAPETLEACLRGHPAVAGAALLRPGAPEADGPATAIIVPRREALPGAGLAAELRDFMRARFPDRLCPRRIAFARDLPEHRSGLPLAALLEGTAGLGAGAPPA
ncbi:AMP-binding protein [Roseomonas sp. HF4]|uniref:AMP-binding protein n=1 Tax=Roseomonas sp. HF4 TaxID=2562313 RepID=UPI0010C00F0F|nr:AMP-binding protein [Roseomonas sp. HF4]